MSKELKKKVDSLFFFVFLLIVGIIVVLKTRTSFVIESSLESMRKSCKQASPRLHVFVDAGPDENSSQQAMDCVCRALDMADCPETINIFIIIPTQVFSKRSPWDTQLEPICNAQSRYATFFESSVHLYKMGVSRYGNGGVSIIAEIVDELETVQQNDVVVVLPLLTKLDMHWDTNILSDWEGVSPNCILSYPMKHVPTLEQDIEGFLLRKDIKSLPSFYFINSFFNLESRSFAKPSENPLESLYASTKYPFVTRKSSLISLRGFSEEDFQFSYQLFSKSYKIFLGMHAIGFSYLKNRSSFPRGLSENLESNFQSWANDIGLLVTEENTTVLLHGKLGVGKQVSLQEKIIKYGTEIKYQTFREALIAEELEKKKI